MKGLRRVLQTFQMKLNPSKCTTRSYAPATILWHLLPLSLSSVSEKHSYAKKHGCLKSSLVVGFQFYFPVVAAHHCPGSSIASSLQKCEKNPNNNNKNPTQMEFSWSNVTKHPFPPVNAEKCTQSYYQDILPHISKITLIFLHYDWKNRKHLSKK